VPGGEETITPSARSRAYPNPFGPIGASRSGTSIGLGGAYPGEWIMRQRAPSTSTASPCRSARSWVKYSASSDHLIGFWPMARAPVKPVPTANVSRPGARSSMVAIADAVTMTWRRNPTATPVATPMWSVASATRATPTQTSPYSAGES